MIQVRINDTHHTGKAIGFKDVYYVTDVLLPLSYDYSAVTAIDELLEEQPVVAAFDDEKGPPILLTFQPNRVGVELGAAGYQSAFGPLSSTVRSHRSPMISGE